MVVKKGTQSTHKEKQPIPNPHLRDARKDHGWSQEDLAERIGTSSVNVSRWENGSTSPAPIFASNSARFLANSLLSWAC